MNNILKPLYESITLKGNVSALLNDIRNHYRVIDKYTSYDDNREFLDSMITSHFKGKNPKQFIYVELINNKPVYKLPREMTGYTGFTEKLDALIKELAKEVVNDSDTAGAIVIDIKNKQLSTMFITAIPEYLAWRPNETLYFLFYNPTLVDTQEYQLHTKNWVFIHELMHALHNTRDESLVQEETFKLMYNLGLLQELRLNVAMMFVLDMLGYTTHSEYTITDYVIDVLFDEDPQLLAEIMGVVHELAITHNVEAVIEATEIILNVLNKLEEYDEREL